MVFIVSDQRIATENFEKGKIYKVVFLDESIFYGVCLGIGSNFVMLSGNISGYLFPLTMETASQVESIDLYTPVEPEPPVPPMTNLLQYQTGLPPFDFTTSGTNLWSYYIKGNTGGVGERTGNLFDISTVEKGCIDNGEVGYVSQTSSLSIEGGTVSFTTTVAYRGVCTGFFEIPEGTETITFNFIRNEALGVKFVFYDSSKTWLNQDYTPQFTEIPPATANVPSGAKYVRLSFTGQIAGGYSYTMSNLMLNAGSTVLPYEPYCYKIPIVCGGQTTNIYIDNPLEADDILYSFQTGIQIPTIVGDDTISVSTTVQPSEMQIVYKIADR